MEYDSKILRDGVERIQAIANEIDHNFPSDPSLHSLVDFWSDINFYFVPDLNERRQKAAQSAEDASREGMGLMIKGLLETFDQVLHEYQGNQPLHDKFLLLLKHIGPLSELRSATGRDIWMDLSGYGESSNVDVPVIADFLVQHNCLPQQCHDKDRENLTDYLVRYSYVFFDDIFHTLENTLPLSWWKNSLETSRVFGADSSLWASDLQRLDGKEAPRAQKILDHYFALTLQEEVEKSLGHSEKTQRKAKI